MQISGTFTCHQILPPGHATIRVSAVEAQTKRRVELSTTDRAVGQSLIIATLDHAALTLSGTWEDTHTETTNPFLLGLLSTQYVLHIAVTQIQSDDTLVLLVEQLLTRYPSGTLMIGRDDDSGHWGIELPDASVRQFPTLDQALVAALEPNTPTPDHEQ